MKHKYCDKVVSAKSTYVGRHLKFCDYIDLGAIYLENSKIGEIRSIVSREVIFMAMTATASQDLRKKEVWSILP